MLGEKAVSPRLVGFSRREHSYEVIHRGYLSSIRKLKTETEIKPKYQTRLQTKYADNLWPSRQNYFRFFCAHTVRNKIPLFSRTIPFPGSFNESHSHTLHMPPTADVEIGGTNGSSKTFELKGKPGTATTTVQGGPAPQAAGGAVAREGRLRERKRADKWLATGKQHLALLFLKYTFKISDSPMSSAHSSHSSVLLKRQFASQRIRKPSLSPSDWCVRKWHEGEYYGQTPMTWAH